MQKSADTPMPFIQDPNFWYLTGLETEEAVLVLDQIKNEEYIILAPRHEHRDLWDGIQTNQEITDRSGIKTVYEHREGWRVLKERLKTAPKIHTMVPPPDMLKFYDFHTNPSRRILAKKLKRLAPKAAIEDLRMAMRDLRIIKQPLEIAAIQKAIDITFIGLKAVWEARRSFKYEYEVEALLTYEYRRHGADGHGFEPITAAGKNAATVHYMKNNEPLKPTDPLLIDTGALVEHYSADISRTLLPSSPMNDRYMAVYNAIQRAHDHAYTLIKPGVLHREYEKEMETFMGEELIKLGLIKKIERKTVRRYFPHVTSHHLGLDLHDLASYDEVWQPGMVLTVEPGMYIPEEGIGVRIEDDILITKDSFKLLNPLGV